MSYVRNFIANTLIGALLAFILLGTCAALVFGLFWLVVVALDGGPLAVFGAILGVGSIVIGISFASDEAKKGGA